MHIMRKKLQLRRVYKYFGFDEWGFSQIPPKTGNVKLSRLLNGRDMGYATDFPHGMDVRNTRYDKIQRSWKMHRKTQFKTRIYPIN